MSCALSSHVVWYHVTRVASSRARLLFCSVSCPVLSCLDLSCPDVSSTISAVLCCVVLCCVVLCSVVVQCWCGEHCRGMSAPVHAYDCCHRRPSSLSGFASDVELCLGPCLCIGAVSSSCHQEWGYACLSLGLLLVRCACALASALVTCPSSHATCVHATRNGMSMSLSMSMSMPLSL